MSPSLYRRQADKSLKKELEACLPNVLAWLVQGSVRWYANPGLRMRQAPAAVTEYNRAYFQDQDKLSSFLNENCDL